MAGDDTGYKEYRVAFAIETTGAGTTWHDSEGRERFLKALPAASTTAETSVHSRASVGLGAQGVSRRPFETSNDDTPRL